MPRANRCIVPGQISHLTHRCQDCRFHSRFGLDLTKYCAGLKDEVFQRKRYVRAYVRKMGLKIGRRATPEKPDRSHLMEIQ